jgi:transcriptional regulator with XRE-family HTH domain
VLLALQGISQKTGIANATLSRIENNKREPSVAQLKAIAEAHSLEVTDLFKTGFHQTKIETASQSRNC